MGTVIGTTGAILVGSMNNTGFNIGFRFTIRTIGAIGTLIGQGEFYNKNSGNILEIINLAPVVIDMTITQTFDLKWKWSVANAGNTITVTDAYLGV